jgi:hypothetical protein
VHLGRNLANGRQLADVYEIAHPWNAPFARGWSSGRSVVPVALTLVVLGLA